MDPVALAGAAALLSVVICVVGWVPARRASRVEPLRAFDVRSGGDLTVGTPNIEHRASNFICV